MREEIARLARNTCLSAGAGAGKTSCLVQTYLGLLEGAPQRPPFMPEQIVAITFTDKAAQEMRQRLARAVAQRARQGAAGRDWAALLPRVEWAPISTIHSFCAALLREHGFLLGLDPQFAVLEAREFDLLRQEVIQGVLRAGLQARSQELARLLGAYSLAGGRNSLAALLAQTQAELATQGLGVAQAGQATARAAAQALTRVPELLAQMGHVVELMKQGLASGEFSATAGYAGKIAQLVEAWPDCYKSLAENIDQPEIIDRIGAMLGGNWGKAKQLKDQAQGLHQELAALAGLPLAASLAADLFSLAGRVDETLEQELRRRSALSFDHLLTLALRLLQGHPGLLTHLRGRWRALLVDEFQDVNPVQGRLVYLLAGLEGPAAQPDQPAPLVLLVGDRKQSIYAFRGADVSVFGQAMARLEAGAGQVAYLPENFRSRPELIDFFNRLFPQVFGQTRHQEPAPEVYVEFGQGDQQSPGQSAPPSGEPALEVLDCRPLGDGQTSLAAWRQLEATALAIHLRGLLAQGQDPGQVVLLFRRLSQVEVYERALRAEGLDYYTVGGRGFYQCQEVGDLLLALRALLHPQDGLALAGLLRSPLIGLNDETLLYLGQAEAHTRRGLPQALAQGGDLPAWLGDEQQARWRAAQDWLAALRPLARRLAPAPLLECLVESSDLLPVWLGTWGGGQKAANLRKLIELARDPRLAGDGADQFCRRLQELVDQPPEDAQAALMGEQAPVLRLMSIHQAKGLEFSVVALADLAFKPRHTPPLLGPGGVMGLKAPDPAGGPSRATPLYTALLERQRALEEAEAARLFYVALTRACQRLIFCLHGAPAKEQGYWGRWLEQHVLNDSLARVLSLSPPALAAQPAPAAPPIAPAPRPAPEAKVILQRCLATPPPPLALVSESVSGLEDWLACPRRYLFTRRLGLDTAWLARPGAALGAGQGRLAQATALGSAVHKLLELADLSQGPAGLDAVLGGLDLAPELAAEARRLAIGWWQCGLPQLLASLGPGRLAREQGFCLFLPAQDSGPAVEVIGELDLVVWPQKGAPLLVDYKVSAQTKPEKYRAQMAMYSLALAQDPGGRGLPPRVYLCYLAPDGARLVPQNFTSQELEHWRNLVLQAGQDLARLAPQTRPSDLPAGPGCVGQDCALLGSGLCAGA